MPKDREHVDEISLLHACARTEADAASIERIQALIRRPLNWDWLTPMAVRQGLFPLLYHSLRRVAPKAIPPVTLSRWQQLIDRNSAHTLHHVHVLSKLMTSLAEQGIRAIPYKGLALAKMVYGDLGLRWAGDLDLLVHPRDYKLVETFLLSNGYKKSCVQWHASQFLHFTQPINLDIHRGVVPRRYRFKLHFDDLWDRCSTLAISPELSISTLCLEDLLVILSLELIKDSPHASLLRAIKIADIAEIAKLLGSTNWSSLVKGMKYSGFYRPICFALLAANRLLSVPLPLEVQGALNQQSNLLGPVDQALGLLYDQSQHRFPYFHELKTVLVTQDGVNTKAAVIMHFFLARAKSLSNTNLS